MAVERVWIYLSAGIGLLIATGLIYCAWKPFFTIYRRPWSIKKLLIGFKAKMWMTFGLGLVFFSFYFLLVLLCSKYINQEMGAALFFSAYRSPRLFIYGGLLLFACVSLTIYLVRMIIKYLFITRGRGD